MRSGTNRPKLRVLLLGAVLSALVLLGLLLMLYLESYEMELASVPENSDGLEVHYLDVGQADCILLQCDGANMLIDGGNVEDSDLVVAYLLEQGVTTLDLVVNTHAHEDHVGGLPGVLAVFETKNVWCPVKTYGSTCFEDFVKYADQQELELVCPEPGSTWALGGAEVQVLGPVKDDYDTNNSSIILRVEYGATAFVFTGDAETEAEKDVLEAGFDVSATVLKVGHHGSETSSSYRWLREVGAEYAVIQVGEGNSYDHPHEVILSRLRDADMTVYRTDLQPPAWWCRELSAGPLGVSVSPGGGQAASEETGARSALSGDRARAPA